MKRIISLILSAALLAAAPGAPVLAQEQVINLRDADIRAFIQDVARATGQTFVIDPRVQGRVSVVSQEPLSRTELFEVMLSTLRANGLVAIPTGTGAYRIAPEEGVASQPSSAGGGLGFATQVFRLRTLDAASAAETLKPLVGRQGVILPSRRGNLLVVADYADNLRRIRTLLSQIDQDSSVTETVTLRSSSAREMGEVINELLKAPGEAAGARNGVVSVVVVGSSNSLILRGDAATIRPLLATIADLDRRAESSSDIRVIQLQHANADQLLPVLQQLVGQTVSAPATAGGSAGSTPAAATTAATGAAIGGGAARANIARFAGANAIVIAADPETQRTLAEVIRQLDTRRQQVLVEAIVVEVSDDTAKRLGVQFALAGTNGSSVPFMATNYSNSAPNLMAITGALAAQENLPEDSSTLALLRDTALKSLLGANGVITGGGGRINDDALFGFIVNAVKNDTASNLLSTPSILTQDNQEAKILVGQEVPITTGEVLGDANANPFRTIQRQNVGVQLEVKPQINAGGAITLFLRQEVSSVAGPVSENFNELILNKREIETTVSVDDGEIIVLGGLLDQNERTSVERIPLLGDIPGLGHLFRSTARQGGKTNLMVFIRPTIVRSAAEARAVTATRYGYIRDQQAARSKDGISELDQLVREYMRAAPPVSAPMPAAPPPPSQLPAPR
ncbi:MAG: type II secretion system secretin GspD [Phenylobacterium sp.]|uniref:type II secretion system secretin GspD n=1 Tax=Phenylobacterium sp. TaxID=1871053 RepID=UPI0027203330|nr:type II secretion system secretin GspD [Phenylobacterium sp.]MDO8910590.1 type II secretion system secretin GspD [Phenylobacterium sp.]MDP2010278.1 type II secretion system secretin GspD [Phenylobacterium sp.]MDP3102333.1 type II secretion system secretin GspD [Phenylobacterium sp.]